LSQGGTTQVEMHQLLQQRLRVLALRSDIKDNDVNHDTMKHGNLSGN